MANVNTNPELRFTGFSEDWEECSLNQISNLLTGYPFTSKQFQNEGILLIRGMNVKRGYIDLSKSIAEFWSTSQGLEMYLLQEGDVVIQMDGALIGKSYAKVEAKHLPALLVQRVTRLRSDLNTRELIYQFIQRDFLEYINSIKTETAVPHLSIDDIKNFRLSIPKNPEERFAIGNFLSTIDKLITQHKQKHTKLKSLKQAMLDKMFPKQGQLIPEIRFKGFLGKWEKTDLGSFVKITMGQSPNGINYTNNPNDAILVQGNADMKNGKVLPRVWTKQITKTADFGDIIFSVRAPVGEVGRTFFNVVIGRGVAAIKGDEFLFQTLKKMNKDDFWKKLSAGSTFDSINSSELSSAEILVPSRDEQKLIGNYFKNLDELITSHNTQIRKLQNIKNAFLAKMFI